MDYPRLIPVPDWLRKEMIAIASTKDNFMEACFELHDRLGFIKRHVENEANQELSGTANNLRAYATLEPLVFQYVLKHVSRNMDDDTLPETVIAIMSEDDEILFKRERTFEGYELTLHGTPAYFIEDGLKIAIRPEQPYMIRAEAPAPLLEVSKLPVTEGITTHHYEIQQFGASILTHDYVWDTKKLIQQYGLGMTRGILDGKAIVRSD